MNKKLRDNDLRKLLDSPNLESFIDENTRMINRFRQGKLYHRSKKFKKFLEMAPTLLGNHIVIYQDMQVQSYVQQFNEFKSLISKDYPTILQKETQFTQHKIFSKENLIHPMEIVKKTLLFYNELTGSELMNEIGNLGIKLLNINSKAKNSKITDSEGTRIIQETRKFLQKRDNTVLETLQSTINKNESYPDKEEFNQLLDQLRSLQTFLNRAVIRYKKKPTENIKDFIVGIQDSQSHIEYFCKYFHRLVHIKKYGNQEYDKFYYQYFSKKFDDELFRDMCQTELNDFPDLQCYLRRLCITFKELRNIRAHQAAGKAKILSGGYIWVPKIGKEAGKRIDYKEKRGKIITYGLFVNKIKLHLTSPYVIDEDVFVSLG